MNGTTKVKTKVTVGIKGDTDTVITSGLTAGQTIALSTGTAATGSTGTGTLTGTLTGTGAGGGPAGGGGGGGGGFGGGGGGGGGVALRTRLYVSVEPARFVAPVAEIVTRRQGRLTEVRLGEPSLEDVFIHLTGRALR
jgi:hypothetical protein